MGGRAESVLGYWVMVATCDGRLLRYGHPHTPCFPFLDENDALAHAARVASKSTTDSVYVMTVFDNGKLSMRTVCCPDRDSGRRPDDLHGRGILTRW